jgi:hypothetical protein
MLLLILRTEPPASAPCLQTCFCKERLPKTFLKFCYHLLISFINLKLQR